MISLSLMKRSVFKMPVRLSSDVRRRVDSDKRLKNDIKYLGKILGAAIKADDERVYQAVEKNRNLAREVSTVLVLPLSYVTVRPLIVELFLS
jgi:hypothetical protein